MHVVYATEPPPIGQNSSSLHPDTDMPGLECSLILRCQIEGGRKAADILHPSLAFFGRSSRSMMVPRIFSYTFTSVLDGTRTYHVGDVSRLKHSLRRGFYSGVVC